MPARSRKNLAGGSPKPDTYWHRAPDSMTFTKGEYAIVESRANDGFCYELLKNYVHVGMFPTFSQAAKHSEVK